MKKKRATQRKYRRKYRRKYSIRKSKKRRSLRKKSTLKTNQRKQTGGALCNCTGCPECLKPSTFTPFCEEGRPCCRGRFFALKKNGLCGECYVGYERIVEAINKYLRGEGDTSEIEHLIKRSGMDPQVIHEQLTKKDPLVFNSAMRDLTFNKFFQNLLEQYDSYYESTVESYVLRHPIFQNTKIDHLDKELGQLSEERSRVRAGRREHNKKLAEGSEKWLGKRQHRQWQKQTR